MSLARQQFLENLAGLKEAVSLDPLAQGSVGPTDSRGLVILRRGMLITSLIALESFVRDRTTEILEKLSGWPASYKDFPIKLREAALLDALPNLQKYARVLKRQDDDYEALIIDQIRRMSMTTGPVFGFSKFVSGDYTGNLSDTSLKELLSIFQVKDCWNSFRSLSAEAGIGVPSVHEIVKDVIRNRHKSAHSSEYVPTIEDIRSISLNLTCIGLCFDAAMTSSVSYALHDWKRWATGEHNWKDTVQIYYVGKENGKIKLKKPGQARAIRILTAESDGPTNVPRPAAGSVAMILNRDEANRPVAWAIV